MSERHGFFSDVHWYQVIASALAAMTAAWIASRLGVGGTIIGAALGSFVVTVSSNFYAKTLDKGRTLLVQTDRGTVIENQVEGDDVAGALKEADEMSGGHVIGARFVDLKSRLNWKAIIITSVAVLVVVLGVITSYELISGRTYGTTHKGGTTIGKVVRGDNHKPTPTPSEPSSSTPPTPTGPTNGPTEPTTRTPAPTESTPSQSPTPSQEPPTTTEPTPQP